MFSCPVITVNENLQKPNTAAWAEWRLSHSTIEENGQRMCWLRAGEVTAVGEMQVHMKAVDLSHGLMTDLLCVRTDIGTYLPFSPSLSHFYFWCYHQRNIQGNISSVSQESNFDQTKSRSFQCNELQFSGRYKVKLWGDCARRLQLSVFLKYVNHSQLFYHVVFHTLSL